MSVSIIPSSLIHRSLKNFLRVSFPSLWILWMIDCSRSVWFLTHLLITIVDETLYLNQVIFWFFYKLLGCWPCFCITDFSLLWILVLIRNFNLFRGPGLLIFYKIYFLVLKSINHHVWILYDANTLFKRVYRAFAELMVRLELE